MAITKKSKLKFKIRPINQSDREWIKRFIIENWGAEKVVTRRKIFYPHNLPGFVAIKGNKYLGVVTYKVGKNDLEITTMDAVIQNKGIGTALLKAVEKICNRLRLKKIRVITTNDNIDALRFYQLRGFKITAVYPNALEFSRKLKPEIPLIGNYGIPLRDEIELEKIIRY